MANQIEIRDGSPWWLSPDIWVVPGEDPTGSAGQPVAGRNNYVWARVRNNGDSPLTQARINYYWSNPATGVLRSNSTLIGTSFVDLAVGEQKDVLCLTPWIPVVVNDGHECLVAEAVTPLDPLPVPVPDEFDPPAYRQVAQRNLHVIELSEFRTSAAFAIQISANARRPKRGKIQVQTAERLEGNFREVLVRHGLSDDLEPRADLVEFGIADRNDCQAIEPRRQPCHFDFEVAAGGATAVYLHLKANPKAQPGFQLIHVTETYGGKVAGGNSFLIIKK